MSTKCSIKWRAPSEGQPGFHLYEDGFGLWPGAAEPPVYLLLDGVSVQLETKSGGGVSITAELPREMARALGLLPLGDEAPRTLDNLQR